MALLLVLASGASGSIDLTSNATVQATSTSQLTTSVKLSSTAVVVAGVTAGLTTAIKLATQSYCRATVGNRTNYIPTSDTSGATLGIIGSGGVVPAGWATSNFAGITREIVGKGFMPNGDSYIDIRISGTNISGATAYPDVYFNSNVVSAVVGSKYTGSAYIELIAGSRTGFIGVAAISIAETGYTGAYVGGTSGGSVNATRNTVSWTVANAMTSGVKLFVPMAIPNGNTVDATYRLSAPQIEDGLVATAYINTTNGSVSRGFDIVTGISLTSTVSVVTSVISVELTINTVSAQLTSSATVTPSVTVSLNTSIALQVVATCTASIPPPTLNTSIALTSTVLCSANTVDGKNRITNGTFDTDIAGWVNPTGAWSWSGGAALLTGNGTLQPLVQNGAFVPGATYRVEFDVNANGGIGFSDNINQAAGQSATVGHVSKIFTSVVQTLLEIKRVGGTVTGTVDNVSVVQVLDLFVPKSLTTTATVTSTATANLAGDTALTSNAVASSNVTASLTTGISLTSTASVSSNVVKGQELVVNGDFSGGTANWTASTSSLSATGGELTVTSVAGQYGTALQVVPVVPGTSYEINITGKKVTASVGWAIAFGSGAYRNNQLTTSYATSTFDLTPTGSTLNVQIQTINNASSVTVMANNMSVKQSLGLFTQIKLASTAQCGSSATASLTLPAANLTATSSVVTTATASITTSIKLTSSAVVSSSAFSELKIGANLSSNALVSPSVTANLSSSAISLSSSAQVSSTSTANVSTAINLNGSAIATSSASAILSTAIRVSSSAGCSMSGLANLSTTIKLASTAQNVGTQSALLTTKIQITSNQLIVIGINANLATKITLSSQAITASGQTAELTVLSSRVSVKTSVIIDVADNETVLVSSDNTLLPRNTPTSNIERSEAEVVITQGENTSYPNNTPTNKITFSGLTSTLGE